MTLPPQTTDLHALASYHAEWSRATFGPDHVRGPEGPLDHLAREAAEAKAAPDDPSEFGDCLLLVLDAARRAGIPSRRLVLEASRKLRTNLARDWPDWRGQDLSAPIEHVRHGCEPGTMDATAWALVRCESCAEDWNCHAAEDMRMAPHAPGGDLRPICETCFDASQDEVTGKSWTALPRATIGPAAP